MFRRISSLVQSLSARLLLGLLVTMGIVAAVDAVFTYRATTAEWIRRTQEEAARTSELIKHATSYGMLLNRKEDVHQTIRRIAMGPGVAGIRVYDKRGTIIFSAEPKEIGDKVDVKAEACVVCHRGDPPSPAPAPAGRLRQFRRLDGHGVVGYIDPIENRAECSNAACHAHDRRQTILGVLDVRMSTDAMDAAHTRMKRQFLGSLFATVLALALVTVLFVHRLVRRRVRALYQGTRRVASGDLDTHIEIRGQDELAHLAVAFNRMTEDLKKANAELNAASETLEQRVVEKTEELARVQRQVLHMEKMASLGKLSATVAHELNNPLAGILTWAKLVERDLRRLPIVAEKQEELARHLGLIQREAARMGDIVRNLLVFARQGTAKLDQVHLDEVVTRSLQLMEHHLQISNVRLEREGFTGDDTVIADPAQIQQALVALFVNAVEAMRNCDAPVLRVRLAAERDGFRIDVGDTGHGIPEEALPHIFEPFFSTKDKESGVGLGLAVVYGIVQRHGGDIQVKSTVGEGTVFRLWLPRRAIPPEAVPAGLPAAAAG